MRGSRPSRPPISELSWKIVAEGREADRNLSFFETEVAAAAIAPPVAARQVRPSGARGMATKLLPAVRLPPLFLTEVGGTKTNHKAGKRPQRFLKGAMISHPLNT